MTTLLHQLSNLDTLTSALMGGASVQLQPIAGEVPVIRVSIEGRDELPIFVTSSDTQFICLCYLWTDEDVRPERRAELHEALLDLNPSVPLSSFEEPQILRYRPGDFFVAHQDGNTGLMHSEREARRKVSVVLFVNEGYGGGELVFSEWHPARPHGRYAVPAEAGLLAAFPAEATHEVTPVTQGHRYTIVSWFG